MLVLLFEFFELGPVGGDFLLEIDDLPGLGGCGEIGTGFMTSFRIHSSMDP